MTGVPPPTNDGSIPDAVVLWRRIPPGQMTTDDSVASGERPSTANFDDPELSVVIASDCAGGTATLLKGHDGFGVVEFTVGEIRALGWGIVRAPDDQLPGHAHVTGRKSRALRSRLAKVCRMIVNPARMR